MPTSDNQVFWTASWCTVEIRFYLAILSQVLGILHHQLSAVGDPRHPPPGPVPVPPPPPPAPPARTPPTPRLSSQLMLSHEEQQRSSPMHEWVYIFLCMLQTDQLPEDTPYYARLTRGGGRGWTPAAETSAEWLADTMRGVAANLLVGLLVSTQVNWDQD
jgi:hypothetical protein